MRSSYLSYLSYLPLPVVPSFHYSSALMSDSRRRPAGFATAAIGVVVGGLLATPFAWRAAYATWGPEPAAVAPSYLPSLDGPRPRAPFDPGVIEGLERMQPGFVIIGDSMAGRIDEAHLQRISGRGVAPIRYAASGPALWYLVVKNWVVPSRIDPAWVVVFFRDTNLTDTLFRIDGPAPDRTDPMALDEEPELDALVAARLGGPWHGVHTTADRLYGIDRTRRWLEPALSAWAARVVVGTRRRGDLIRQVNDTFALERLRPMDEADMQAAADRDADFAASVASSVLPAMLRLARERGLRLCFVRVLRRPVAGRPPVSSPALDRYMADLGGYIESNGGWLIDDRDDPRMAALAYNDGDHVDRSDRQRYTELFFEAISRLR